MIHVVKAVCSTFLGVLVCYLFVACIVNSLPAGDFIDTTLAPETKYVTEPRYVVWGRDVFKGNDPILLIIGASISREGFSAKLMSERLPGWEVHNLSVSSSNITQMEELVELAYEKIPKDKWTNMHISLCLHFLMLGQDEKMFTNSNGRTYVELEMTRYGLYTKKGSRFVPNGPAFIIKPLECLLRPCFILDGIAENWRESIPALQSGFNPAMDLYRLLTSLIQVKPKPTQIIPIQEVDRPKELKRLAAYFDSPMAIPKDSMDKLERLCDTILQRGSEVILVSMPTASWQREKSPHYELFRQELRDMVARVGQHENFFFLDIGDMFPDSVFRDAYHPRFEARPLWSAALANFILETNYKTN